MFFFTDQATIYIYTLSLHDALPIYQRTQQGPSASARRYPACRLVLTLGAAVELDRKSTRLNSSHRCISYAVFCLKKKNNDLHAVLSVEVVFTSCIYL